MQYKAELDAWKETVLRNLYPNVWPLNRLHRWAQKVVCWTKAGGKAKQTEKTNLE